MTILFVTHLIKSICYAIIVQHTWTVVLLFFLFHFPAKELCDILLNSWALFFSVYNRTVTSQMNSGK